MSDEIKYTIEINPEMSKEELCLIIDRLRNALGVIQELSGELLLGIDKTQPEWHPSPEELIDSFGNKIWEICERELVPEEEE